MPIPHWIKSLLLFAVTIISIFLAGYYRGSYDTKNKLDKEIKRQAERNADTLAEIQNANDQRLAGLERERSRLANGIRLLRTDHCNDIGSPFWMLYNESATGAKSAPPEKPLPLQSIAPTIINNNLTCRELQSEYQLCYDWVQSLGK